MSKLSKFMMFTLGAGLGIGAAWYLFKNKYEQIAQEEIESVKEAFSKKENRKKIAEEAKNKDDISKYANKFGRSSLDSISTVADGLGDKANVTIYSDISKKYRSEEDKKPQKPYVISPDDFGEIDDYETITLTYYSDHILADDNDEMIKDVEFVIGAESLNHFGEYEDDSVFVRNDKLKTDYEILLDSRTYAEVIESKPYLESASELMTDEDWDELNDDDEEDEDEDV